MMNLSPVSSNFNNFLATPTNNKDPSKDISTSHNKIEGVIKNDTKTSEKADSLENKNTKISLSKKNSSEKKSAPEKEQKIQELKRIDSHVKAHEHAHIAAGGPYVRGGPQYTYVIGPDGNRYAIAGEVKIDVSPVPGNPDATIRKAQVIKRAALAPSDPSPQDRAVAAKADQMALKAKIEKYRKQIEEMEKLVEKNNRSKDVGSSQFDESSSSTLTDIIQAGTSTLKKDGIKFYSDNSLPPLFHKIV